MVVKTIDSGARLPEFKSQLSQRPSCVTLNKLLTLSVPQCFHSSTYFVGILLGKLFPSQLFGWSNNEIDTKWTNRRKQI